MNVCLLLVVVFSVLLIGLAQTIASVKHGLLYVRSAEFLESPILETVRWFRVIGDTTYLLSAHFSLPNLFLD